jgi:hypothetical protein
MSNTETVMLIVRIALIGALLVAALIRLLTP